MRNTRFSCNAAGRLRSAALMLLMVLSQQAWAGTDLALVRQLNPSEYRPGESVFVQATITVNPDDGVNSLGLEERIPAGWTYAGFVSGDLPCLEPGVGTSGNNGLLEFAWFNFAPSCSLPLPVVSFIYELTPAMASVGTVTLSGQAIALVNSQQFDSDELETVIVREGSGTPHRGDPNQNFIVSLTELLRVIQFFTNGAYRCRPVNLEFGEDGYVAGALGEQTCVPHDSDFIAPPDFSIQLSELLRFVQLYNAGSYHECEDPESDDGFCPGPPD